MTNPAPADLQLSSLTVNESDVVGVPIGSLQTISTDGIPLPPQGLTYALVEGVGSDDNSRFRLVNGRLQAREIFDRERQSQLSVRIRVSDSVGRSLEKVFTISVNDLPNPVATAPIASPTVAWKGPETVVDLNTGFDDPFATGRVATFQLAQVQSPSGASVAVGNGKIRVLLFDQQGQGAPLTTANLQAYLTANRYSTTLIHRSVPGFVVQGGGFNLTGVQISPVSTFPAVRNEYSPARPNLRGTIAMAKVGLDPNSATSQWFWSLADNSTILNQDNNGGFTVFGRVLGAPDLATLDAMAALPIARKNLGLQPVLSQLPLSNGNLTVDNLLRFSAITINQQAELSYALVANSAPTLLQARLVGGRLQLRSLANRSGQVSLTIRVTNLLGETLDHILQVQLQQRVPATQVAIRRLNDALGNSDPTLARPTLNGTLASALQADERVRILANGQPIGVASLTPGGLGWSFKPAAPLAPRADGTVELTARVETLDGVAGPSSPGWSLQLGSEVKLRAPGSELLRLGDPRPLVLQCSPIGTWDSSFRAWNTGPRNSGGQQVPGTGERVSLTGLNRYGLFLRRSTGTRVTLDLGDGNHAFFLHDSWSPQGADLPSQTDWQGRVTAQRFDQLATIRLGNCSGAGATSLVDLTSPDFITGPIQVLGGNTPGSRNVIWGSAADDTVICGAADTVICGSAGRNLFQLGSGDDRLQYVARGGAEDRVERFDPRRDRIELWGLAPGTLPSVSLQASGNDTVLSWESNQLRLVDTILPLPSPGTLPSWIVVV